MHDSRASFSKRSQYTQACTGSVCLIAQPDVAQQGMEMCGSIPELMHSPLCMDSWRRPTSATEELLAIGDIGGCVTVFNLEEHWTEEKRSENRCSCQPCSAQEADMAISPGTMHTCLK